MRRRLSVVRGAKTRATSDGGVGDPEKLRRSGRKFWRFLGSRECLGSKWKVVRWKIGKVDLDFWKYFGCFWRFLAA